MKRFNLNHTAVRFHLQTVKLDQLLLCLTLTIVLFTRLTYTYFTYILAIINIFLFKYQVCKLIDDSEKSKNPKVNISQDVITEWLLQNKVLSIAFESKFTIYRLN